MTMKTLEFTTTPRKKRTEQPIPVTFCGEQFTVRRPKDATLFFATQIAASDMADANRARALHEFLLGTLEPVDYKRLIDRTCDRADPHVDLEAVTLLVNGLAERWSNWPARGQVAPLVVEVEPTEVYGEPIHVTNAEYGLDFVAHPVKTLVKLLASSAVASGVGDEQQAWAIGMFMDAALDRADRMTLRRRLHDRDDDFELEQLADLVKHLSEQWTPPTNRAQRRELEKQARRAPKAVGGRTRAAIGSGRTTATATGARKAASTRRARG